MNLQKLFEFSSRQFQLAVGMDERELCRLARLLFPALTRINKCVSPSEGFVIYMLPRLARLVPALPANAYLEPCLIDLKPVLQAVVEDWLSAVVGAVNYSAVMLGVVDERYLTWREIDGDEVIYDPLQQRYTAGPKPVPRVVTSVNLTAVCYDYLQALERISLERGDPRQEADDNVEYAEPAGADAS